MRKTKEKNKQSIQQQHDNIAAAVSAADETKLRSFLTRILQEDEKLFERFQSAVSQGTSQKELKRYEKQVDALIRDYLGREGFISYREANSFIQDMTELLESNVSMMLDDGHDGQAFGLSCYVFLKAGSVEIDDSDGGLGILLERCEEIWREILEDADSKVRREIFEWLAAHLDSGVTDYMEESMERVLIEEFSDGEDYTKELLDYTRKKTEETRKEADSWNSGYYVQKWALHHISLMEKAGLGQEEILKYCREHWEYAKVREYYIEASMKRQSYDEAIEALQESIQMDAGLPGLVRQFSARLKEAYRISGRQEDYKKQLWKLVTQTDAGNLESFRELKSLYEKKEWESVREEVFQELPSHARIDRLYREEGLYDRLLEYVLQEKGLYAMREYRNVLEKEYPKQILAKYEKELHEMAARAADRRRYQEWAALLRSMMQIEGGEEKVREIVADWRVRYKNRRAMLEELKQFG